MLNGLEVRVPFLDHELVDFVFSLPSEWKLRNGNRKSLLKDAYKDSIPKQIIQRKKKGFEVPLGDWFKGPLKGKIDDLLSKRAINDIGILNYEKVKGIIDRSRSNNPGDSNYLIWSMLVFQQWMAKYNPKQ
jgi:asparagine synthase (glutamine-hydrolysing)